MKKIITILLMCCSLSSGAQRQGRQFVDSLLGALPTLKEDSNKVLLLYRMAFVLQNVNPKEGLHYSQVALALAEKLSWEKGIGLANNVLGINYDAEADYIKALDCHFKALQINQAAGNQLETARTLENIAFVYQDESNHLKALEYCFKALNIFQQVNDKNGEAATLGEIGSAYQSEHDYAKALEFHNKSLNIHKATGDKHGMAANMGNIGLVYSSQNNYPQALVYDVMALNMYRDLGDKNGEERNLGNLGNVYTSLHDYTKALDYDFKALQLAEELQDKNIIAANNGNIGEIYLLIVRDTTKNVMGGNDLSVYKAASLQKSIDYLTKGVNISTEIGLLDAVIEFKQYLSEAYTLAGDPQKALTNYKESNSLKDSLFSEANKQKVTQMGTQFDSELKQRDIQIAGLSAAKQRNERTLIIVCAALLLLLAAIFIRNRTTKRRPVP